MFSVRGAVFILFAAVIGLTAVQCGTRNAEGTAVQESNDSNVQTPPAGGTSTDPEVLVETVLLRPRAMQSYILLSSTVEAENMVDVYPRVAGNVVKIAVEEGDYAAKGDLLLLIDDRDLKLAAQKAEVNFRKLDADLKRKKESFEKNIISQVDYENAEFTSREAELNWKQAQQNLSYTRVTAPINGVITERPVRNGDRIQISTKVFRIVDTSEKIARVFIPEKEINRVVVGQEALVSTEFLDNRTFKGTVKRISPVVDPTSGTFKVTIGLVDPDDALHVGMFATIRIITSVRQEVIAVPKDAIVYDGGVPYVYVVRDSIANKVLLDAGFSDEQYIESRSTLRENDEIIVVGQNGLKDKTKVRIVSPASGTVEKS